LIIYVVNDQGQMDREFLAVLPAAVQLVEQEEICNVVEQQRGDDLVHPEIGAQRPGHGGQDPHLHRFLIFTRQTMKAGFGDEETDAPGRGRR
jgi:hypothetical protein